MVKYLESESIDVTVLSPHPTVPIGTFPRDWSLKSEKMIDGIKVINLWTWQPGKKDPGFISRMAYYLIFALHAALWALLNSRKYDVILTSTPQIFINAPGLVAKKLRGKAWIIDVRDLWIDASISLGFIKKDSLYEKLSRLFEEHCYKNADIICVTTGELKNRLVSEYGCIRRNRVSVIPNGADISSFYPCSPDKKTQIIYVGNVGHAQDLESAILAMKDVTGRHDVKLVIVGDGDIKERLMRVAEENQLGHAVTFVGVVPRSEIASRLSESLIGIAPLKNLKSLEYAIPTKVYEYMACGIPFIGCGKGEIANIAEESGAGVIAENTPESIARAINLLLDDPAMMQRMGSSGREYAMAKCDRKLIANNLRALIERNYNFSKIDKKFAHISTPSIEVPVDR